MWQTSTRNAIKVFAGRDPFDRELAVYLRLHERAVIEVCGHEVPRFIACDDALLVIEMSIVTPPYILDFAGAYVDAARPDFPPEVLEEWEAERREMFGANWKTARLIIARFEALGIILNDIHPGNIAFAAP